MKETTLYIKNMVCDRCKTSVRDALESLHFTMISVELGIVCVEGKPDVERMEKLERKLGQLGFEILKDRQQQITDRIKSEIVNLVHYLNNRSDMTLSSYLSDKLGTDYSLLSKLFSENTGMTIERFFILQKTERIKELLFYNEMSLNEIACMMNYSSPAYLSTQFKNITGMTPSQFKAQKKINLIQLDKI